MARGIKTGGRQKGTPNKLTANIKALASVHGADAIATLVEIAKNAAEPAAARVAAANSLLDRGFGRPAQAVELTGKDGAPLLPASSLTDDELAAIAAAKAKPATKQ